MAVAVGWPPGQALEVAAVATAESDRRRCVCSYCCCGLLQIHLSAHGVSKSDMCNPLKNLRKGLEIWRGSGNSFESDWFANWDSDAKEKYNAVIASSPKEVGKFQDAIEGWEGRGGAFKEAIDDINPIDDVAEAIVAIGKFIARLFEPEFWVRVGKGILGAGAVAFGVIILSKAILGFDIPGSTRRYGRGRRGGGGGALTDSDDYEERAAEAGRRTERKRAARERGKIEERERRNKEWRKELDQPPF